MAYLDINAMSAAPNMAQKTNRVGSAAQDVAGFSPLELSVIALARQDPISSVAEPGRVSRALTALFGFGKPTKLAEPRLEALRRLSVYAWKRGRTLPASEISQFLQAGFSKHQFDTLVASIAGGRSGQFARRIAK